MVMMVSSVIKISGTNDHFIPPFRRRKFVFPPYKVKYLNMNVFTFSPHLFLQGYLKITNFEIGKMAE